MLAEKIETSSPTLPISTAFNAADIREGRFAVSPLAARAILAEHNYKRQRPVRAPHVAFLADEMRRGNFVAGTQLVFAQLGDALILVNGQHRLTAQAICEATVEYQVLVQRAENDDDVARFYYRQDRGGRARSDAEVLQAIGVAQEFGLSPTAVRAVFRAIPLIDNHFMRPSMLTDPTLRNDDLRLESCKPWWPIAEAYEYIAKPAPRVVHKKLLTSAVMAVALVTLKHQPEKARLFWEGVAKDDALPRNDPRKALLISFANREWRNKSADAAMACALAWNAFFTGRPLSVVKVHSASIVRIMGTPYDGRRL